MRRGGRLAILGLSVAAGVIWPTHVSAEPIAVLAGSHPPWLKDLFHELETAGFVPRMGTRPAEDRWALRVTSAPGQIEILRRAGDGTDWLVDESVPVAAKTENRRRAIVRAVEILRARRAAAELAAPAPGEPPATAKPAAPADAETKATATVRANGEPAPPRAPPLQGVSLGITSGGVGARGGLGTLVFVGLVARWAGPHLSLWSRAETGAIKTTVTGAEGRAEIGVMTLSVGAAWSSRDATTAAWTPFVGAEVNGHLVQAKGEGSTGFRGQTIVVPGLSLGGVAGLRLAVTNHVAAVVQAFAGFVTWEPIVTFAGRRAAAWQGPLLAATLDLSWRF